MPARRKFPQNVAAFRKAYWRAADAREVLDQWRRSGVTLTEFARAHDLSRGRLARWKERPGEEARPRFHRIKLVGAPVIPAARGSDGAAVEIVVGGARRVVVRRGFDAELLAEVLRVLESAGC